MNLPVIRRKWWIALLLGRCLFATGALLIVLSGNSFSQFVVGVLFIFLWIPFFYAPCQVCGVSFSRGRDGENGMATGYYAFLACRCSNCGAVAGRPIGEGRKEE